MTHIDANSSSRKGAYGWPIQSFVFVAASAVINVAFLIWGVVEVVSTSFLEPVAELTFLGVSLAMAMMAGGALLGIRRHWRDWICTLLAITSSLWSLLIVLGGVLGIIGGAV